jgi:hypothetical protein
MVLSTALLKRELAVYETAQIKPNLGLIQGGKLSSGQLSLAGSQFPSERTLVREASDSRRHTGVREVPDGYMVCLHPPCGELLEIPVGKESVVTCSQGHCFDLDDEERRYYENPGGISKCGLSNTDQGRLGEAIIEDLGLISGVGRVQRANNYHGPLDFTVTRCRRGLRIQRGAEVKSYNVNSDYPEFGIGADERASKYGRIATDPRLADGLVGIFVVIDYQRMAAAIYVQILHGTGHFRPHTRNLVEIVDIRKSYERVIGPIDLSAAPAEVDHSDDSFLGYS